MKKALNWIIGISLLVSLFCNGLQFYYLHNQGSPECIYVTDTMVIHKDSIIEKIKYVTQFDTIIEIQYIDTLSHDTLHIHDTIQIPIEHKVDSFSITKDSLTFNEKIHHSGFHSIIDSIELDYAWNYTIPRPKQKNIGLVWNIGLYAGYGMNFNNGQYYFSPEIGIGGSIGIGGFIPIRQR